MRKHVGRPVHFANGTFRALFYRPLLGEDLSRLITDIQFLPLFGIAVYFFLRKIHDRYDSRNLWIIGLIWAVLTVIVEFLIAHYLMLYTVDEYLAMYNVFAGHRWTFILIWIVITPSLIDKFFVRKRIN